MALQQKVNIFPAGGMPGDLFKNPVNAFGAVAKEPLTIGTGVWGDNRKLVVNNKANTGSDLGLFLGFVVNMRDSILPAINSEAAAVIPAGRQVTVLTQGALIVKAATTGSVAVGDYVAVSAADGTVQTQNNNTSAIAGHSFIPGWSVIEVIDADNKVIAISNVDNTFHVGSAPAVTRGLQSTGRGGY